MSAAALATMREFPDIREDCDRIDNGINGASKDLTSKLKQVRRPPFLPNTPAYMQVFGAYMRVTDTKPITHNTHS